MLWEINSNDDQQIQAHVQEATIPTEILTRQIRQNLKSVTVKITNAPKFSFWFLSRSFWLEPWHCSADIKGPLSVNLPELPIRNLEEFEVGNGKNCYLHPKKFPVFWVDQ